AARQTGRPTPNRAPNAEPVPPHARRPKFHLLARVRVAADGCAPYVDARSTTSPAAKGGSMRGGMRRRPWRRGNRTSAARGAPQPLDRGVLGTCVDRRTMLRITGGAAVVLPLAACGDADAAPNTLRISYQQFGSGTIMRDYLTGVMEAYSTRHPDVTVELVPLVAAEEDYFTKNELMMSSSRTTPDLVYEDTFILQSDVAAGYLRPID